MNAAFWFGIHFELRGLAPYGRAKLSLVTSAGDNWTAEYSTTTASYSFMEIVTDARYFRGPVTVTLTVDPANALKESNERNNVLKARLTVSQRGAPKTESASRCSKLS